MKIVIPGNPIPKARHRDGLRQGKRIKYDPQQQAKQNVTASLQWTIRKWFNGESKEKAIDAQKLVNSKAFTMHCIFHMPIPQNDSHSVRNAKLWGLIPHNTKPDASNLLKFYEDAANKILYEDDSMLCDVRAVKKWSTNPRTEIHINPMKNVDKSQSDILSIISPQQVYELGKIFLKLPLCFIDPDYFDYELEDSEDSRKAAAILSEMADKFGDKLAKISKKCPGYWQK